MDVSKQQEGEKRVQELLIAPLDLMGLTKPGTMRKEQFELMRRELRQKLAYMSPQGLMSLCEWCQQHPGGKERDRFPIALHVLDQARRIEPPEAGPSPLMLKVFAHEIGQKAISEGWAPELHVWLKGNRQWPGAWTLSKIRESADEGMRRLRDIESRLARVGEVSREEEQFRQRRRAAIRACEDMVAS